MTESQYNGQPQSTRLDRIETLLERVAVRLDELAVRQANTQQQLDNLTLRQANTQQQIDDLTSTANSIFARDAILNDVLLELRDSHETHQRNFEKHQRTTNAALNQLGAILIQLTRIDPQN